MSESIRVNAKRPQTKQGNSLVKGSKPEALHAVSSPSDHIFHLQRTVGNEAVQRLLRNNAIQPKLTIGKPGDKYEREADRIADQVMRMPEPQVQSQVEDEEEETIQTKPIAEKITPLVQRQVEPEEEEEETAQAKAKGERNSIISDHLESGIHSLKGGGQPLSSSARTFFEPRFDHDFSKVRVHSDTEAAEQAEALNARAFTVGNKIIFAEGQYSTGGESGKRLLAHELTHVIQQHGNNQTTIMRQAGALPVEVKTKHHIIGQALIRDAEAHRGVGCLEKEWNLVILNALDQSFTENAPCNLIILGESLHSRLESQDENEGYNQVIREKLRSISGIPRENEAFMELIASARNLLQNSNERINKGEMTIEQFDTEYMRQNI